MSLQFPLVIDGGLSTVLEAKGCDLNHALWSARLLIQNPEAIQAAHVDYLNAGAKVLITSSYQASIQGLVEAGYDMDTAENILLNTVVLASDAIKETQREALIAASIGPYGAYLSDGSEYTGKYGLTVAELEAFHAPQFELLDTTAADFFACETIPSFTEAQALASLLRKTKKPAWISFACQDEEHINDGTPIAKCAALFNDHPNILALGVNCTHPKYISGLMEQLKSVWSGLLVIYPNSGEVFDATTKTWIDTSHNEAYALMAKKWVDEGADFIGGCCRIGPQHIKEVRAQLG